MMAIRASTQKMVTENPKLLCIINKEVEWSDVDTGTGRQSMEGIREIGQIEWFF